MKNLAALFFSVCVSTFVYAQDPSSQDRGVASEKPLAFEFPKKIEPLYVVNDSAVVTADQFKAIDPTHIQSIEVRRYDNRIVEAHNDAERRGVILIYLKGHRSFSSQHSGVASEKPLTFELPKKIEPLYVVNDTNVITADQFKAINPAHIQSIEVRRYDNSIVAAQTDAARRGVILIYLKDHRSFSEEFSSQKKNPVKN